MRIHGPIIPNHILAKMSPEDRPKGKAGMTTDELSAFSDAKRESELQAQCVALLLHRGIIADRSAFHKPTTRIKGWPDLTFAINGQACVVECKFGTNQLDPDQIKVSNQLMAPPNNWLFATVWTLAEFKSVIDKWMNDTLK